MINWQAFNSDYHSGNSNSGDIVMNNIETYVDEVIPPRLSEKYLLLLENAMKLPEFRYNQDLADEIESKVPGNIKVAAYTSGKTHIGYIISDYEDYENLPDMHDGAYEAEHIFFMNEESVLILGERYSHPEVITRDFEYACSDGSGPGVFNIADPNSKKPDEILQRAIEVYKGYVNDEYH